MSFYRFHNTEAPAFTADNAWSGLMGSEFNADGSQTKCPVCDGTGQDDTDPVCSSCGGDGCDTCDHTGMNADCADCDGEGWQDCVRGFSSCRTAEDLVRYFSERAQPRDHEGVVYVFEGYQAGTGFDGEPCVVPERVIKEMTWSEFVATVA